MNKSKKLNRIIFALIIVAILCIATIIPTFASVSGTNEYYVGYGDGNDPCLQINVSSKLNTGAAITVLTHGQNGRASSWSNDANAFAYDEMSMIE